MSLPRGGEVQEAVRIKRGLLNFDHTLPVREYVPDHIDSQDSQWDFSRSVEAVL